MKNKIIVIVAGIVVLTTGITLWFNYFGTGNEALTSVNAEINMVEQQMLQNKAERTIIDNKVSNLKSEQEVYKKANNELRKQLKELNDEKKKLGL